MPVSPLDLAVVGIVLISAFLASVRGFTREVLAIISWVAAAVSSYYFYPQALPYAKQYISNSTVALIAAIAAVFLVTLIVVALITVKISDFILDSKIGPLDRSLGFLFGAARGALIALVAFAFFVWLVPEKSQPGWVKDSRVRPLLEPAGETLVNLHILWLRLASIGRHLGSDDQIEKEVRRSDRRGRILEFGGALLHFCVECGRFGPFGYGVSLRAGQLGRWYCREHRPQGPEP